MSRQKRREVRFTVKRWMAVLASNLGWELQHGELDILAKDNPAWYAVARRYSANDPRLLRALQRALQRSTP